MLPMNPFADSEYKKTVEKEVSRVRRQIRKLSLEDRRLVKIGEAIVKDRIDREIKGNNPDTNFCIDHLNVFDLGENINGEVMKYICMLVVAYGYEKVHIDCTRFSSHGDRYSVKYPNAISFRTHRWMPQQS